MTLEKKDKRGNLLSNSRWNILQPDVRINIVDLWSKSQLDVRRQFHLMTC